MLVAFEGQDGAGKTAVLVAVHEQLQQHGTASLVVEEFWLSRHGCGSSWADVGLFVG